MCWYICAYWDKRSQNKYWVDVGTFLAKFLLVCWFCQAERTFCPHAGCKLKIAVQEVQ